MSIKIALAGNPNSGKTTMFNDITGSSQYVGNWPGVTVEKKDGRLKNHSDVIIQDLPGIYSLSPYTLEEVVTRNYLIKECPDAIINIVDGTNIERNLYLTTQLLELGIPVIIAINMIDIVHKRGDEINLQWLGDFLGCEVLETSALKGQGSVTVAERAIQLVKEKKSVKISHMFDGVVEHALAHIEESIETIVPADKLRWYAIKVFERDEKILAELTLEATLKTHLEEHIKDCERELDDDSESIIANQRYQYITKVVKACVNKNSAGKRKISDRIDSIVTNRYLAFPIFIVVMFLVYYVSITTIGAIATDWTTDVLFGDLVPRALTNLFAATNVAPWLSGLVIDGIVAGVGAVLGFVPQMFVLFFMLSILEDCGYMARVAFIMDRLFRKFGLSGKSFIPMLIGSGCSVPGIMACRTIEQERDRRMTIMTTPFIPCGAKLPIIALISGALFGGAWWVAPSAYFIGILAVVFSGIILKKTKPFAGSAAPFVMELPSYHFPSPKNVFTSTWERGFSFIKKAGTIILLSSIVLWFLQQYGFENGRFTEVVNNDTSMLAYLGKFIAPIFVPLGFGSWENTVATITGLIAKENVVGTLGVLHGFAGGEGTEFLDLVRQNFTTLSAFSFMLFNLLCSPCVAAMGAIRREMSSGKWTLFALGYLTAFAYAISLILYQTGLLFTTGSFTVFTALGLLVLIGLSYLIFRKNPHRK